MNFSVVIPTYNRSEDLNKCIFSISTQSILPAEVVIIDDGISSDEYLEKLKSLVESKGVSFVYYKKDHSAEPRGLSESKNIALRLIKNKLFFILDDDVVLLKDFFKSIMQHWEQSDDQLMGVGGVIKNNRRKTNLEIFFNRIFGLTSQYSWDINNIAFQVWDDWIDSPEKGYYAHGGVSSLNRDLVKELGFTTFSGGRTALEDVDFCLRAKNKGYYFIVDPAAKVLHNQSLVSREAEFKIGRKEGMNRRIIFKKNCVQNIKNRGLFLWATIGWILRQFLVGHFAKGLGLILGSFDRKKIF